MVLVDSENVRTERNVSIYLIHLSYVIIEKTKAWRWEDTGLKIPVDRVQCL